MACLLCVYMTDLAVRILYKTRCCDCKQPLPLFLTVFGACLFVMLASSNPTEKKQPRLVSLVHVNWKTPCGRGRLFAGETTQNMTVVWLHLWVVYADQCRLPEVTPWVAKNNEEAVACTYFAPTILAVRVKKENCMEEVKENTGACHTSL